MKFSIRFTVDEASVGPTLAALNNHPAAIFEHLEIVPVTHHPEKLVKEIQKTIEKARRVGKAVEAAPLKLSKSPPLTRGQVILLHLRRRNKPVTTRAIGQVLFRRGLGTKSKDILELFVKEGSIRQVGPHLYEAVKVDTYWRNDDEAIKQGEGPTT